LAQSQADAAAAADAATPAPAVAEQGTSGKSKTAQSEPGDGSSALAFLPQTLAAALAGAQVLTPPQPTQQISTASADDEPTESITGPGAGLGAAGQAVLASVAKGAADLQQATIPGSAKGVQDKAQIAGTPESTAITPDGTNTPAIAFQAHMSISSQIQQPASAVNGNKVESPVGTPAFNDELGGKITWLANQGIQSASLQLSPEHLGPVNVHISVQDGSATVSFNAAHADTRTALEQALPRLREMFSTQGLNLADASVSHQSPRGQPQKQSISSISAIGASSEESNATSITSVASARLGLVDTYA
jgi:flagellar hook-length control protein FliK